MLEVAPATCVFLAAKTAKEALNYRCCEAL